MEFYSQTTGGLFHDCKPCVCARVRANRLVNLEQYTEYERGRASAPHRVEARKNYAQTPEGRAAHQRAHRKFVALNPTKRRAHFAVSNALRDGKLARQACEVCGAEKAQAHHDDYSKPLDVRWLCTTHHAEWHRHNTPKCPDQEQAA